MSDQYAHVRNLPLLGVLTALGFTEWKPRKNGTEWAGKCPVHQPKKNTGSFSFHADGRFQCFSCSAKGKGAIDAVMAIKQVNFRSAVEVLEGLSVQVAAPSHTVAEELSNSQAVAENPPVTLTYHKYFVESRWLAERGFAPETLEKFGVGEYDNPKRQSAYKGKILLPVRRWDGQLVAYLARTKEPAEGESKYTWPKGFRKSLELFGAWQIKNDVKQLPLRIAYVVESPFAVMKFAQLGLPAVSPFGFCVSPEQANLLFQLARGWIVLPDRNKFEEVGQSVALIARGAWVKTPRLPDGIDDPERLTYDQIVALTASS